MKIFKISFELFQKLLEEDNSEDFPYICSKIPFPQVNNFKIYTNSSISAIALIVVLDEIKNKQRLKKAFIQLFEVAKSQRRKKIGTEFVKELKKALFKEFKCSFIELCPKDAKAELFWKSLDFYKDPYCTGKTNTLKADLSESD